MQKDYSQSYKKLLNWFEENATKENYLFHIKDIVIIMPELSFSALKTLLSRLVKRGYLERISRGIYGYNVSKFLNGNLLYDVAGMLRGDEFYYLSQEVALSRNGEISQQPINYLSFMTTGRSNKIYCNKYGLIEFVHTKLTPIDVKDCLEFDSVTRTWIADSVQAKIDLKRSRRNVDLITTDD